jgi:superfamily II DNA or RNA helicase
MITFTIGNSLSHIDQPQVIQSVIANKLNIRREGYVKAWMPNKDTGRPELKTKYHPTFINVYNRLDQTFPTGRLGYIANWCKENNIPHTLNDVRKKPEKTLQIEYVGPPSDGSNGLPARPYQLTAPSIVEKATRGILWHATASGKTITAARIICHLGVKTLYMVPSLELLHQTSEDLQKVLKGVTVGKIGEGIWDPKEITVATTATLWSRLKNPECIALLKNVDLLIADECHHISSKDEIATDPKGYKTRTADVNTWYIIALSCPAYYRIGMTGTPGKDIDTKRALLECAFGRVIDRISTKTLIDLEIACPIEVHFHKIDHKESYEDYNVAHLEGVLQNATFNNYIAQLAITELKAGSKVLIITSSKAHQGPAIMNALKNYGYEVPFVCGDDSRSDRKQFREDFRAGKIPAIISTVYKEGVDFPLLSAIILADGGKDEKRTIQVLGRVLRSAKGKKLGRLHDFYHLDGSVSKGRYREGKYLEKHSKARMQHYIEEELENIIMHEPS